MKFAPKLTNLFKNCQNLIKKVSRLEQIWLLCCNISYTTLYFQLLLFGCTKVCTIGGFGMHAPTICHVCGPIGPVLLKCVGVFFSSLSIITHANYSFFFICTTQSQTVLYRRRAAREDNLSSGMQRPLVHTLYANRTSVPLRLGACVSPDRYTTKPRSDSSVDYKKPRALCIN